MRPVPPDVRRDIAPHHHRRCHAGLSTHNPRPNASGEATVIGESHAHEWVFDWENPPGFACSVDGCDAFKHACRNCEEPSMREFCSEMCEFEFEERTATPANRKEG